MTRPNWTIYSKGARWWSWCCPSTAPSCPRAAYGSRVV